MSESDDRLDARWAALGCVMPPTAALLFLTALALPARAIPAASRSEVSGVATVVDGDTLDVAGQRVRLEGIDAPETAQTCRRRAGETWACGRSAADALAGLVERRRVTCEAKGVDRYDRMLGVCRVDGRELNAEMVRRGLAWAFVKYSASYVTVEAEARASGAGVWQGEAEPPWIFRENRWSTAETLAPDGCAIKGNITANGRIYHTPWSPWYGRVKVDAGRGERWFCSEEEAERAGWRSAAAR